EQAGRGRRLQLDLARRVVLGRQVPALLLDVVGDRRLVEEVLVLEQEGASAGVRAHVELELVAAAHPGIAGPLVAEVDLFLLDRDAIHDARRLVPEGALGPVPRRRTARARHRGAREALVEARGARPPRLVPDVRWLGGRAGGEGARPGRRRGIQGKHRGAHRGDRQQTGAWPAHCPRLYTAVVRPEQIVLPGLRRLEWP